MDFKALGKYAKELRVHSGLSQTEVAAMIGSSQPNVSAAEKGHDTRYVAVTIKIIRMLGHREITGPFYCVQE